MNRDDAALAANVFTAIAKAWRIVASMNGPLSAGMLPFSPAIKRAPFRMDSSDPEAVGWNQQNFTLIGTES